ncbi:MAG: hypothetical protein ACE5HU_08590, partial [Acidobacteriota bacterium]
QDPSLQRRIVRDIVIYSPSNRRVWLRARQGVHMFRRRDLDPFLRRRAEDAGVTLVRDKVRSVRPLSGGQWELATDRGCAGPFDYLVGADGVQSVVRRRVATAYRPLRLTLALYAYVAGVACSRMVLKFFKDFEGYLWVFPRVDHLSVGICAPHRSVGSDRLREELLGFLDRHYPQGRVTARDLRGYLIPSDPEPPRIGNPQPGRATWALVGDAAGFVDPMTREGIAHAMRSAAALAACVAAGRRLRTPDVPVNLAWAHRHRRVFFRERSLEGMVRLAGGSGAIRRVLADLFEGRQEYRSLKARLLLNAVPCGLQAAWGGLRAMAHPVGSDRAASS